MARHARMFFDHQGPGNRDGFREVPNYFQLVLIKIGVDQQGGFGFKMQGKKDKRPFPVHGLHKEPDKIPVFKLVVQVPNFLGENM